MFLIFVLWPFFVDSFFFPAHLFQEPKIGVSVNVFYVPMSFKQMWFFLLPKLDIRHAES